MSVNAMQAEANLFRTLAHPFRLQLLELLRAEEACVCHLSAYFDKPQSYVSKHLAGLRDAGLVVDRRDGQRVYYRLSDPSLGTVLDDARIAMRHLGASPGEEAERLEPRYPVAGCECPRCTPA
ncbi:MAG: metalloregulator ArsR/SmtB family transcription factor [Dehalococcoidales bacterium]|nr:metalloregulator ArsR/SmtB family transcription factor [Dehalococcoidales bacterium]